MVTDDESRGRQTQCGRDDRKSAAIAAQRLKIPQTAMRIGTFGAARAILRSAEMKQAGLGGEDFAFLNPEHAPVFFLDGEPHRKKRSAIARFFTPKAIETAHQHVMRASTEALIGQLCAKGHGRLDQIAWLLAVNVAGDIVGLTAGLSERQKIRLARRIEGVLERTRLHTYRGLKRQVMNVVYGARILKFALLHVRPAIRARRRSPRNDIISHLVAEGYSQAGILIECMTYAGAGMVTTREFIVMVAWHFFERAEMVERFLASDEAQQTAILEEILRLEPIAALLFRVADDAQGAALPDGVVPGDTYAIDLRGVNHDETATGPCPFALDPDRAATLKVSGSYLSFGDGSHRCPGAQVALTETRIFIDSLFRVPGIRLHRAPTVDWNDSLMSYELRGALIACDRSLAPGVQEPGEIMRST